ncbi:hypothetical protein B0H16DRAFT_1470557 [Mycena metata]|uniref:Uncharacterized protein n=1 Tax=Mycena metata TaxID=1033252 RepID=A0AAD7MS57_9AGAR|nr:hypothetical protein B0H16DRAFT_1470557 [Mycena metata]
MENTDLNAAAELVKVTQLLRAYGKKNSSSKKKAGGNTYKQGLEERMAKCQALITQCLLPETFFTSNFHIAIAATMDANAPTLQGSPNDDPMTGGGLQTPERLSKAILDARAAAAAAAQQDPPIDPALKDSELPPAKKSRANDGQSMHRKIIEENPIDVVADAISPRMISTFTTHWRTYEIQLHKADPSMSAEGFEDLYEAATDIIDRVEHIVEKTGLSYAALKWNLKRATDGGPVQVSDVITLRQWLIASGAMVGDIPPASVPAPAAKKVSTEPTIKIWVDGKKRTMTSAMMTEARKDPKAYPGCVEAGMKTVAAVLKNRSGREKCVSCDSMRGKALESRPAPHPDDGEFLAQCKCPLRGAALELWMIKMTAEMDGIPQRGDDDMKNSRLAFNPDTLKLIAGAIQAVSGHEVETLLKPEVDRLELTVHWALKELTLYAARDDSQYAASFRYLLTQFKQTMVEWEKEQEEDQVRKN